MQEKKSEAEKEASAVSIFWHYLRKASAQIQS